VVQIAKGRFLFPQFQESKVIAADNKIWTKVLVTIEGSGSELKFEVGTSNTWDGTYTWTEIPSSGGAITNVDKTLDSSGTFLKWRAIGVNYTTTQINIKPRTS